MGKSSFTRISAHFIFTTQRCDYYFFNTCIVYIFTKQIWMQECSKISSLVCMEADGSTLVATGYENGKLDLWGGTDKTK